MHIMHVPTKKYSLATKFAFTVICFHMYAANLLQYAAKKVTLRSVSSCDVIAMLHSVIHNFDVALHYVANSNMICIVLWYICFIL